ncbi:MAG: hypothetical protein AB7L28_09240, partial [Kofleriaceae bacterium]
GALVVVSWSAASTIVFMTIAAFGFQLSRGHSTAFVREVIIAALILEVLIVWRALRARRAIIAAPRATVVMRHRRAPRASKRVSQSPGHSTRRP